MEENANKLHFECTSFNSSTRVTVYAECIYVLTEYLKYLSIRRHSSIFFDKSSDLLLNVGRQHSKRSAAMLRFLVSRSVETRSFCRLSDEATENTWSSLKKTKLAETAGTSEAEVYRTSCEQCSSRLSAPVHGAS